MDIFFAIFYQPLYNLLVWFYDAWPGAGIGLAIVAVTVVIKGLLFPLTFKTLKSQKDMQEIQPIIKEIREKYKDDKETMSKELMAVYKENNVNPFASCLPLLVQLPIFIALFQVLQKGLGEVDPTILYGFVHNPGVIESVSFGIDLAVGSIPLAVAAAIAQYYQVKYTVQTRPAPDVRKQSGAMDEDMAASMNKMMIYMMPAMTLLFGSTSLPGGIMLYWLVTTFLTIILYKIFLSDKKTVKVGNVVEVEAKK